MRSALLYYLAAPAYEPLPCHQTDKLLRAVLMQTLCSRGFGFVTYATKEDMLAAIDAMDGHQVDGRDITVQIATGPVRGRDGTEKRWSAGAGYLAGKRRRR